MYQVGINTSSWTLNAADNSAVGHDLGIHTSVAPTLFNTMIYTVIIKHHIYALESYLQGCEQSFDTEQQAQDYIQTFEDWEQDLLEIDFNPF